MSDKENNPWDTVFPQKRSDSIVDLASSFISGSLVNNNFPPIKLDIWESNASIKDIEILHIRMDNPGMSRQDAEDLFEMHKTMGILHG